MQFSFAGGLFMIKKRFLLPAAAGALALTIGLAGIWFNQRLPALADFGVPGMDPAAKYMCLGYNYDANSQWGHNWIQIFAK